MYKHILVPTDGSPLSSTAVETSLSFAREIGAKATVLTIVEPFHVLSAHTEQLANTRAEYEEHANRHAGQILEEAEVKAEALGVPVETLQVESDEPYEAIIEAANQKGCDLIAMASHGRRGVSALVIGSVTTKVLTHSKIPVLVYR